MNGPNELMGKLSDNITTMTALVGLLGGNSATAEAISGSSDKHSAEYKAALRNVQRYQKAEAQEVNAKTGKAKQGRGSVRGAAKLKAIRKAQANKLKKKALKAEAPGEIRISQGIYNRNVRTDFSATGAMNPANVDAMLDAFVEGNAGDAWAAFEQGIMDAYGLPNSQYETEEIDDLWLGWE